MRKSGILMPVFSLGSRFGIGTLGKCAYDFADFLEAASQSYWQILPINPTGYGNSPYQCLSCFAGNPYLIDLEILKEKNLLSEKELSELECGLNAQYIDYSLLYKTRIPVLKKAGGRLLEENCTEYIEFCEEEADWLNEYAIFAVIKEKHGDSPWNEWEKELRLCNKNALQNFSTENEKEIEIQKAIQFLFFEQWKSLKKYVNSNGIKIIGDLPIYASYDSADVYFNRDNFCLNADGSPSFVAGCPPDAFNEYGQLWGNPIYDWDYMKKDSYSWWKKRFSSSKNLFDGIRIDHFRGFESFYRIKSTEKNAKNGEWIKGPGIDFFKQTESSYSGCEIIAEDLGFITEGTRELLKKTGFPGMKVLQFAFDSRENSDYLPHNYPENCVAYTGTHDNSTILGWFESADANDTVFAREYLRLSEAEGLNWGMMKACLASRARLSILCAQDLLSLSNEARLNTPSTLQGNWVWRAQSDAFNSTLARKLKKYTEIYRRTNKDSGD